MPDAATGAQTIHIRLISEAGPPKEHEGRPTEFGLKDKKLQLHRGLERPDGSVQFDVGVEVRTIGPTASLRFFGPFVLGKTDEQFIGLIWNYADEHKTIRGQKIRLDTLSAKLIYQASRGSGGILQATVVPVTEKTATIPVEWTLIPGSN
jgi:hypothetical protein